MAHRWKPFLGAEPATSPIGNSRANIADDRGMVLEMGVGPYTRISHVKISVILQIEIKKNTLVNENKGTLDIFTVICVASAKSEATNSGLHHIYKHT